MNNFKFTFETNNDYMEATKTGYIDSFDIVRVNVKYSDGCQVDFPVKSREEFNQLIDNASKNGNEILEMYQAEHYYDVAEYE